MVINDSGSTMTFAGLAANTTYSFTLLSVRANDFYFGEGTYALAYDGSAAGVTTTLTGSGTQTDNVITGFAEGNGSGLNAREITWSFTTGDVAEDAVLSLSGDWNVNAIIIIPESSTTILGALGFLALLRRRR